jgi:Type I restriction enzyme HindI endonuclease subunit-like, C-terminal/N-6 DNA Methylase
VVGLLVEMIEPFKGRVYDPCCGSSGMFVQSEEFILQHGGKPRFLEVVTRLSHAFALSVPHEDVLRIRDEVAFFQTVRGALVKATPVSGKTKDDLDSAIRQIVSRAVASDQVVDIFTAAGLMRPDIAILSDDFLEDMRRLPHRNLALSCFRSSWLTKSSSGSDSTSSRAVSSPRCSPKPSASTRTARSRPLKSSPS